MSRTTALALSLLAAGLLTAGSARAADTASPAGKPVAAKPAAKPAANKPSANKPSASASRKDLHSQAKGLALATGVTETINASQLEIAKRVYTGTAQCEFQQTVSVDALADRPAHFKVSFNKAAYVMTPQETTTGAVRLEDKKNGIVWLQIPAKSMMLNQQVGQRMVDGCMHAQQRSAPAVQASLLKAR